MAATIRDVAQRAKVSPSTVSRVLNGHQKVDPKLARRVQSAAKVLVYRPSRAARALRVKRSQVIGLVLSDIQNPFFTALVGAVEEVAYSHGLSLILCSSGEDLERERLYTELLHAERVAGAIVTTTDERRGRAGVELLLREGIPVVAVDRLIAGLNIDSVVIDNVEGARLATRHLIDDGHRRIGFIGGRTSVTTGHDRRRGFELAHSEAGLPVSRGLIRTGDFKFESGRAEAIRLLALATPPTALLAANNLMTLGALTALRERGLRIPDDVAIVGFDDPLWASAFTPPLTTVAQPIYAEGRMAAELLIRRMSYPDAPVQSVVLPATLIQRASCGPHRGFSDGRSPSPEADTAGITTKTPSSRRQLNAAE